jgi:NAD(P)-dependent dehydrogenase (short-subunit alcohol dehydrogenase family)
MGVNLKSIFFSLKHGLAHLRQQERSYIVNIASVSSFVGQASTPAYTTSKHAVVGLTRSIALDYAVDGLRCNAICPGITDTPMLRRCCAIT